MSSLLEKFKNMLGLNDDEMMDEEEHNEESVLTESEPQISEELSVMQEEKKKRVVRPNPVNNNIIDFSAPPSNEMVIVEPKGYDDAMKVVSLLKSKKSVIVNVLGSSLNAEDTDHILDFICGAVYAIDGNQKTVTKEGGVYLFTPGNININTMDSEQPKSVDKSGNNLFLTINDITSKKTKVS
jgi:FtsZ-interacting cell division protein YlmF